MGRRGGTSGAVLFALRIATAFFLGFALMGLFQPASSFCVRLDGLVSAPTQLAAGIAVRLDLAQGLCVA